MLADGIILATNKPVMATGGFAGSDPILTTNQLASLVAHGIVRFFLLGNTQNALTTWVGQHCTSVPTQLWETPSTIAGTSGNLGPDGANQLYDCTTPHK
jgi:hypothetical protein